MESDDTTVAPEGVPEHVFLVDPDGMPTVSVEVRGAIREGLELAQQIAGASDDPAAVWQVVLDARAAAGHAWPAISTVALVVVGNCVIGPTLECLNVAGVSAGDVGEAMNARFERFAKDGG